MPARDQRRLWMVVLVKAAPVLTSNLDETMCVAGVEMIEGEPRWVRLHPVPFRDLEEDHRFRKYQEIEADVFRPKSDRRPETWSPLSGTIEVHDALSSKNAWAQRRHIVDALPQYDMCDLVALNQSGSGPDVPSLAVVRPAGPPRFVVTAREAAKLDVWRTRAAGAAGRQSLFDDGPAKAPFEVIPWRFRYHYRCQSARCNGHEQTIVDWEAAALWRKVRYLPDWQEQMKRKFVDDMWGNRDTTLFVGNMEERPNAFLVLGVFWPPMAPVQQSLGL